MGKVTNVAQRVAIQFPRAVNWLWARAYPIFRKPERYDGSEYEAGLEETFTLIHDDNRWGSEESVSGDGSSLNQTIMIRHALPKIIRDLELTSLLDAPCGDFHWMQNVKFHSAVTYVGGDIVKSMVEKLQNTYGDDQRRFVVLDIVNDKLPSSDLWLCRDVLFHLSNDDVIKVMQNFVASEVKYLLTTTYNFVDQNEDITSGGFRFINLRKAPFYLPRPRLAIDDYLAPEPPRKLGLWTRADVERALGARVVRSSREI